MDEKLLQLFEDSIKGIVIALTNGTVLATSGITLDPRSAVYLGASFTSFFESAPKEVKVKIYPFMMNHLSSLEKDFPQAIKEIELLKKELDKLSVPSAEIPLSKVDKFLN